MCGIFGYIGFIEQDIGTQCLRTLKHRGPDGEGVFHNSEIFLGHRRLAILDTSAAGDQPMTDPSGRYTMVYNGEVYNFIEIRHELEQLGRVFQSNSDSEVVLAAFIVWGEEFVHKCNGMWALAIWDHQEKSLFVSRDRFGKKPLFYTTIDSDFVFASEMKALTPLMSSVEYHQELVSDLDHIFYYESTEQCLIKGIRRLPAGHSAWLRNGQITLKRYWCTLDHLVEVPDTYEEQVTEFKRLFLDACRIRMRSDVPVGTALSGGLDSSAIFSALSHISANEQEERTSQDWRHAYTASFPGTPLDEAMWAQQVTDYCHSSINVIQIKPEEFLECFDHDTYLFEELYITPHIPFFAIYGAMQRDGVKVTIDGHGADELFGGYGFDYIHILHDTIGNIHDSLSVARTYLDSQLSGSSQFAPRQSLWVFVLQQWAKNLIKKIIGYHNTCSDDQHPRWRELDYFTQKLYISFHQTVLPTLLRNYDRYSMANGVEIRMPFMDHRLVSYAFSLHWKSKIRNGYTKAIVRDAVADFTPHEVVYRKTKIGFNAPMVDWFKGPLREFFTRALQSEEFKKSSIIDAARVTQLVQDVITSPQATFHQAEHAWKMIAPYFWRRGFFDRVHKK